MMSLEEVRRALQRVKIPVAAIETGLAPQTIYRVVNKQGEPSYDTIKRLSDWIESIPRAEALYSWAKTEGKQ